MIRRMWVLMMLVLPVITMGQESTHLFVEFENEVASFAEVRVGQHRKSTNFEGQVSFNLQHPDTAIILYPQAKPKSIWITPGGTYSIQLESRGSTQLNPVVVTATRTHLDRRESPIAVQVLGEDLLNATQSVSVAEGLSFRPGLRMEYNCQNCGFSQVRLNGLSGPYTQILIDGRPVFSALSGVYGLEQLPSSMIERVEVIRGGGSSMYGGNAIAGTINLVTKEPTMDEWEVRSQTTLLGMRTPDQVIQAHGSRVYGKSGFQLWTSARSREPFNANPDALYDRDGDGNAETEDDFSEITKLRSIALGGRYWYRPTSNSRLQVEGRCLYEFRRGGNRFAYEPHEADIAEQLIHKVAGFNGQYEWMSSDGLQRWTIYSATTFTQRESYYGAGGNDPDPDVRERAQLFYGDTEDQIANGGMLYGWGPNEFHSLLVGLDYQYNHVSDVMPGYGRNIDQTVSTPAVFAQWKWNLNEFLTFQAGARYDRPMITSTNTFGGEPAFQNTTTYDALNPRLSLLYKAKHNFRIRTSFATGFRAPQAFDEDLHLSTLGGAARIVVLSNNLEVERSNSWNLGLEWDHKVGPWEGRTSIDGFYTRLIQPFVDVPFTGALVENGDTLALFDTKVNDPNGAFVAGVNVETEWVSPNWTLQAGWTLQRARYEEPIEWYDGFSSKQMLRAPWSYGYAVIGYFPAEHWEIDASATFTGSMITPNERLATLVTTPFFADINLSVQRTWDIKNAHFTVEAGVYNILNSYQSDVEVGWERDANYFFGPIRPRSLYLSLSLGI
ncbi:MAG: TonB-dependent receptor [Flavobacteriia bacterium]|nr:TonB-dependent receptor [Flavobacteriia bacterium]